MMAHRPDILEADGQRLAEITIIPWDSEIFGFAVAELKPAVSALGDGKTKLLADWLRDTIAKKAIRLVSTHLPATEVEAIASLAAIGFRVVDCALDARLPRLHRAKLPSARGNLRPATCADLPAIERIAGTSFAFGRYHGDGRFSRVLADRRYQVWARRAVLEASDSEPMLVLDGPAGVAAFMQVAIADGSAVLKLAAVDTSTEHGLLGYQLYVSTLALLQDRGCAEVTARISAANTAVLNLYAGLGFQFGRAETILHLHP